MRNYDAFFLGGITGGMVMALLLYLFLAPEPTAMDVYRGKTTLEITWRDGVAVDSTVVFKELEE